MGKLYEELIIDLPDYPTKGVVFKDVTPVLADPSAFSMVVDDLAEHFMGRGVTKVLGAEARGFMVGSAVAYRLCAGFIPARKPGKLPREVVERAYELEYGTDRLQVHADSMGPSDKVLIIDDLIATGGTAIAMLQLVEDLGAELVGMGFFMELAFLNPRKALEKATDAEVFSLVQV